MRGIKPHAKPFGKSGLLHFHACSGKEQGFAGAGDTFLIGIQQEDMVEIFLRESFSVHREDLCLVPGHIPVFGEIEVMFGHAGCEVAAMRDGKVEGPKGNGNGLGLQGNLGGGSIQLGNLWNVMRPGSSRVMSQN